VPEKRRRVGVVSWLLALEHVPGWWGLSLNMQVTSANGAKIHSSSFGQKWHENRQRAQEGMGMRMRMRLELLAGISCSFPRPEFWGSQE